MTERYLWWDCETYCETPIQSGTHRYAEGAEIMLVSWALDDGPVSVWDWTAGEPCPYDLMEALLDDEVLIVAHKSDFDRTVLRHVAPHLCPPLHRWRDSMVKALAHGLPGGLDKIGTILGLSAEDAKHQGGKEFINLFCKPQAFRHDLTRAQFASKKEFDAAVAAARDAWPGRATRHTHPEKWEQFKAYAGNDIQAMRIIYRKLPKWNYEGAELALWHLDQQINDAGVYIDQDLCRAAIAAAEKSKAEEIEKARRAEAFAVEQAYGEWLARTYGDRSSNLQRWRAYKATLAS